MLTLAAFSPKSDEKLSDPPSLRMPASMSGPAGASEEMPLLNTSDAVSGFVPLPKRNLSAAPIAPPEWETPPPTVKERTGV